MVILHGLLGSSRNWAGLLKTLGKDLACHALDLRNHGQSPHAASMDYGELVADVRAYLDKAGLERVALVGHSLGGKVAMALACASPERVSHLLVVDIAPKPYPPRWEKEFAAMRALPVAEMKSRAEAEAALEPAVSDWAFRKFLLTNLGRREGGGFEWTVNLPLLEASLPALFEHPLAAEDHYAGPTLFLRGEHSRFVRDEDVARIEAHFPQATLETIAGAGHNVHFDQPAAFEKALRRLLEN